MDYELRQISAYNEEAILPLYSGVGWTAYTDAPDSLQQGFENSLFILGAYHENTLVGLIRTVGDGHTIVFIQDLLVLPEYQRQGIGSQLLTAILVRYSHVRQISLATDNSPKTAAFYRSLGLREYSEIGCLGFTKI